MTQQNSFGARALGVLLDPTTTFDEIAAQPNYWGPLIVLMAGSVALTETLTSKIGIRNIILRSLHQSGQARHMTPEQLDQALRNATAVAHVLTPVGAVVGPPIFLALAAGVGLLILRGIFGAQASFKTIFSVTCYAALPTVIGDLMGMAVLLFGDLSRLNPQSPIPTSLGFFLDSASTPRPLYALASSLDLLTFWFLALVAVGLSRASRGQVKAKTIFAIYFGIWLVLTLGKMGLAWLA